ncbi:hypothetical protein [Rheinheimera nanhaiensis]|uniref:hypothetical protein n=1 Tax=Rheinheimera nanhaiensis TaxID=1163621 RepID=UPI00059003DF|nr:hypothetical protein [Rheinheimera nanhaiensis]
MRIVLIFVFLFGFASSVSANGLEELAHTKVSAIQGYADYGNGDFIFTVEAVGQVCKGYWLAKSSPGTANLIALIIAAQKAKSTISIWGHTDAGNKWAGASKHYCKVYSVLDAG